MTILGKPKTKKGLAMSRKTTEVSPKSVTDTRCPHKNCRHPRTYSHGALHNVTPRLAEAIGVIHLQCDANEDHRWAFKIGGSDAN